MVCTQCSRPQKQLRVSLWRLACCGVRRSAQGVEYEAQRLGSTHSEQVWVLKCSYRQGSNQASGWSCQQRSSWAGNTPVSLRQRQHGRYLLVEKGTTLLRKTFTSLHRLLISRVETRVEQLTQHPVSCLEWTKQQPFVVAPQERRVSRCQQVWVTFVERVLSKNLAPDTFGGFV